MFGLDGNGSVEVPHNYAGTTLSGSMTFDGQTLTSLGLTPGTYVYTWGSGADADKETVNIGTAIPEPSTWVMMALGLG